MRNIFAVVSLFFVLLGCGTTDSGEDPIQGAKVSVLVFSAPWCETCEHVLPAFDAKLNSELSAVKNLIDAKLYVVTGTKASQPPSNQVSADYHQRLGLSFPGQSDPWKWTNYKKYFEGTALPALVVLSESGEVLKSFNPGAFTVEEVSSYLQTVVQNEN